MFTHTSDGVSQAVLAEVRSVSGPGLDSVYCDDVKGEYAEKAVYDWNRNAARRGFLWPVARTRMAAPDLEVAVPIGERQAPPSG